MHKRGTIEMPMPIDTNRLIVSIEASSIVTLIFTPPPSKCFTRPLARGRAYAVKNEGFVLKVFHLHCATRCKRVRGIDDQRHLISMNRDDLEPRILDRQGNDSEIKRSFDHPLGDLTSDGAMDVDLNLRIGLLERGQNLGQHVKASGLVCSKPQLPATQSTQFSEREHRLFSQPQQSPRVVGQQLPACREPDALAHSVKQPLAQLVLELFDRRAYSWLSASKPFAGARKTLLLRDCEEHF